MLFKVLFAILFVALLIIGAVLGGISLYKASEVTTSGYNWSDSDKASARASKRKLTNKGIAGLIFAGVSLFLFILVPWNFHQVESGEIAVVRHMGKIENVRESGVHFDFWMTNTYEKYDTKVRQVNITTASYSKDSQPIDIEMVVQYQVNKAEVKNIALTYGSLTALEDRIQSVTIEKTKAIISQYNAEGLISERPELSAKVTEGVGNALATGYYIHVTNIALTNIDFSDAFEASVEAKMIAEQTKLQKDYENEAAEAAAETAKKVAEMQADAEAYAKEKAAEAEAKAIIAKANAEAEALNIQALEVARMLGMTEVVNGVEKIKDDADTALIKAYIEYIKYLESWNGELPDTMVGDGVEVILPSNK